MKKSHEKEPKVAKDGKTVWIARNSHSWGYGSCWSNIESPYVIYLIEPVSREGVYTSKEKLCQIERNLFEKTYPNLKLRPGGCLKAELLFEEILVMRNNKGDINRNWL